MAGDPGEIARRLQVATGQELTESGAYAWLDGSTWWARRQQIRAP
jgi:hypothetical protein